MQTTAPLAPPAIRLVNATSVAVFLLNTPNLRSIQGFLVTLPVSGLVDVEDCDKFSVGVVWSEGPVLRIRLVEV